MRNFLLGIIVTLLALAVGALWYTRTGRVNFQADQTPPQLERWFAGGASDAYVERNAPKTRNPVPATEQNVLAGAQLYMDHCAGCHGTPSSPDTPLMHSFNPPVPRFFKHAPDMPDNQNFLVIQHGIRFTGMPAWDKTLSDQQMWQITTFLSAIPHLPPAAQKVLSPSSGTIPSPPAARTSSGG
jgi:mono/diheme cytochrome c family protein